MVAVLLAMYALALFVGLGGAGGGWFDVCVIGAVAVGVIAFAGMAFGGSARVLRIASESVACGYAVMLTLGLFIQLLGGPESVARLLASMLTLPCIIAALAWSSRVAVGYAVATVGLVGVSAAIAGATRDFVVVWVGNLVFCLVAVTIVRIAVRTAERLDETLAESLQASAQTAATTARAAARQAFADLMHDWVLATLLAAERDGDSITLQRQAHLTLERLDSGWAHQRETIFAAEAVASISAAVADVSDVSKPATTVNADGGTVYPVEVVDAVAAGVAEAVRNSMRHAGVDATVRIVADDDSLVAAVTDDGEGFELAEVSKGRIGLDRIQTRMHGVGGSVHVESAPGEGTRVNLAWRRPVAVSHRGVTLPAVSGFGSGTSRIAVAAFAAAAIVCAYAVEGRTRDSGAVLLAVVVMTLGAHILATSKRDPLTVPVAATLAAVGPIALALVVAATELPIVSDSQLWPIALASSLYPMVCVRGRLGWASIGVVAMEAEALVLAAESEQLGSVWVLGALEAVGALLFGIVIGLNIRSTARTIMHERAEMARAVADSAADAAVSDERARQQIELGSQAQPVLLRIARGEFTSEDRVDAGVMEVRLRSQIRAQGLMDPAIVASMDAAGRRGADVVLLDDGDGQWPLEPSVRDRFLTAVAAEIDSCGSSTTVIVRISPRHNHCAATIVVRGASGPRHVRFDRDGYPIVIDLDQPAIESDYR